MNSITWRHQSTLPSGLRLGVQELTRVGFSQDEMADVAKLYARVLLLERSLRLFEKMFMHSNQGTKSSVIASMRMSELDILNRWAADGSVSIGLSR